MDTVLEMRNITKKFGDVIANDNVSFDVKAGEVHTLLGENGAGKSTLMNILSGLYRATDGEIFINGKKAGITCPADAVRNGIGMVHQHFMLVEAMTVFENIILGKNKNYGLLIDKKKLKSKILELSEKYGLEIELDKKINDISVGAQQRVEILKALYRGAELLILDEPTAVLTDEETEGLFDIIHKLTSEGKSVIFISHKMREVMKISSRVTILRNGATIDTYDIDSVTPQELANKMTGRTIVEEKYEKNDSDGEIVIHLNDVSFRKNNKHNGVNKINLDVRAGEIVGIAGVDGNGQSQLAQLVTGNIAPDEGDVEVHGEKIHRYTPERFIKLNISHIPEDRNKMGLIGGMSVTENLVLKNTEKPLFSKIHGWYLCKKKIKSTAEEFQDKYDIRCASVSQLSKDLSGGNQQKVILARELEQHPDLLIAVHPTRGLDIGATQFIHDTMIKAKKDGCAILLISADLDEILTLSDRIAVMYEGKIMDIYSGKQPPLSKISMAMAGKK